MTKPGFEQRDDQSRCSRCRTAVAPRELHVIVPRFFRSDRAATFRNHFDCIVALDTWLARNLLTATEDEPATHPTETPA
jgi:hypothetical protein